MIQQTTSVQNSINLSQTEKRDLVKAAVQLRDIVVLLALQSLKDKLRTEAEKNRNLSEGMARLIDENGKQWTFTGNILKSIDTESMGNKFKWIQSKNLQMQLNYVFSTVISGMLAVLEEASQPNSSIAQSESKFVHMVCVIEDLKPEKLEESLLIKEAVINTFSDFAQGQDAWPLDIKPIWDMEFLKSREKK